MAQASDNNNGKLSKELGLWDVYAISTGAMFSSGFFLLPGLATAEAGPSTVLAYLLAGLLIIPSMLSMAELSTALPRAGGTYYFLDRALGPAIGTIGGMGTWLALVLKSAFALLGIGAYLAVTPYIGQYFGAEGGTSLWLMKALAVALTVVFVALNIFGAKESSKLQGTLVAILLGVLAFFVVQGLWYVFFRLPEGQLSRQYSPFLHQEKGLAGLISTVGLVFVSYAGLTKVASVSEEVKKPERNLPLGMFLSLLTAKVVYVLGVFVMVAVLDPGELRDDYTPVATAGEQFFTWLPGSTGVILIVIAALAAFASTGNAGVLAASRYPLAMARDRLTPERFGKVGRFGTPTLAVLVTGAAMIVFIVAFSAEGVAKLASAFNLLVFAMINLAVIVMRESRIESYDPGFKSPLYPWTQVAGVLIGGWLIVEMGWLSILFSLGIIVASAIWYARYARPKVKRFGAVHHVFERLGRYRHAALDTEFREILKEKGLRDADPFDEIIARADVLEIEQGASFDDVIRRASQSLARRVPLDPETIERRFHMTGRYGGASSARGVLPHFRDAAIDGKSEVVLVRAKHGLCVDLPTDDPQSEEAKKGPQRSCDVCAAFFVVSGEEQYGQHLRILAQIAGRLEDDAFMDAWCRVANHQKLKEVLLRDERFLPLYVGRTAPTTTLVGKRLRDIKLHPSALVGMIRRDYATFTPTADTVLQKGDRLTIIGDPKAIEALYQKYVDPGTAAEEEAQDVHAATPG